MTKKISKKSLSLILFLVVGLFFAVGGATIYLTARNTDKNTEQAATITRDLSAPCPSGYYPHALEAICVKGIAQNDLPKCQGRATTEENTANAHVCSTGNTLRNECNTGSVLYNKTCIPERSTAGVPVFPACPEHANGMVVIQPKSENYDRCIADQLVYYYCIDGFHRSNEKCVPNEK